MVRLRRSTPTQPGWTRRRAGKGFVYLDEEGARLAVSDSERCKALVIPPAWADVWICRWHNGHLQAVGTDEAERRQYLYHPEWRVQRDAAKHDRVLKVAARLPRAREVVAQHLAEPGMSRERALATAFRLLDLGFFRIGGETYAEQNGSYGLATISKDHVRIEDGSVVFEYTAKSGKERYVALAEQEVLDSVTALKRRRSGSEKLLAFRDGSRWRDVSSDDINEYVKTVVSGEVSAKDFRTWHATVLAAVALAVSTHAADSESKRRRAVARAMKEVSEYLGNTPAVCRASYVDPRVVDLFEDGVTIEHALKHLGESTRPGFPATHGPIEKATLNLLKKAPRSSGRAKRR